jgi:hypothetical protein
MSAIVAALKPIEEKVETKEPQPTKEPKVIVSDAKTEKQKEPEPQLSIYEKIKRRPYTADFFKINEWDSLDGELDVDGIRSMVKDIESFIGKEISKKQLEDTTESYRYLIDKYSKELGILPTETYLSKIKRLSTYFDLIGKQMKLEEKRRKLIGF